MCFAHICHLCYHVASLRVPQAWNGVAKTWHMPLGCPAGMSRHATSLSSRGTPPDILQDAPRSWVSMQAAPSPTWRPSASSAIALSAFPWALAPSCTAAPRNRLSPETPAHICQINQQLFLQNPNSLLNWIYMQRITRQRALACMHCSSCKGVETSKRLLPRNS